MSWPKWSYQGQLNINCSIYSKLYVRVKQVMNDYEQKAKGKWHIIWTTTFLGMNFDFFLLKIFHS